MITPEEIKKKAQKRYGDFLRASIVRASLFPMTFPVGKIPKNYPDLLKTVNQLIEGAKGSKAENKTDDRGGYSIDFKTLTPRGLASQSVPKRIYLETETDYLALLQKEIEFSQFKADVALIQSSTPSLTPWLNRFPLKVIEHAGDWPDLLKVCRYFQEHPKPNLYIRELPIAVHTKFVEAHQEVLRSLLEEILPDEHLMPVDGRKHTFEKRFSLRYSEPLLRLRILDPTLQQMYGFPVADFSLKVSDFGQLQLGTPRCFVTENLMPFLTLPKLDNSIAVFGSGYANQRLKAVDWLRQCPIFYWGDMDVDGFKILAQLRSHFPQTQSILMDSATYEHFGSFSVSVAAQSANDLPNLTEDERALYTYLATEGQRLEQERISQTYSNQSLQGLASGGD